MSHRNLSRIFFFEKFSADTLMSFTSKKFIPEFNRTNLNIP